MSFLIFNLIIFPVKAVCVCVCARSPQIAIQLLVHKIHSPQEWEALQALTVSDRVAHTQTHSYTELWSDVYLLLAPI